MNGHQTRRTLTLSSWLSRLGSYGWALQNISSQAKEHRWTEERFAANVGPAATGLNQQGHTEAHKKTLSLCERSDWNVLLEKNV